MKICFKIPTRFRNTYPSIIESDYLLASDRKLLLIGHSLSTKELYTYRNKSYCPYMESPGRLGSRGWLSEGAGLLIKLATPKIPLYNGVAYVNLILKLVSVLRNRNRYDGHRATVNRRSDCSNHKSFQFAQGEKDSFNYALPSSYQ